VSSWSMAVGLKTWRFIGNYTQIFENSNWQWSAIRKLFLLYKLEKINKELQFAADLHIIEKM